MALNLLLLQLLHCSNALQQCQLIRQLTDSLLTTFCSILHC